jgi:hypothetical protein
LDDLELDAVGMDEVDVVEERRFTGCQLRRG